MVSYEIANGLPKMIKKKVIERAHNVNYTMKLWD
jgi:hypothetical protein